MFDTHCHLNFKAYRKQLAEVIEDAKNQGVSTILIPGTDLATSLKAVEIADLYEGLYVAAGIHPHHVFDLFIRSSSNEPETSDLVTNELAEIEKLLKHTKVVAVGEIGLDRHMYIQTKYDNYTVSDEFVTFQKTIMVKQIELAIQYEKSIVIHNREAAPDLLDVMSQIWTPVLEKRVVFHCCEANETLLSYAMDKGIYIGIDGDITYGEEKKNFISKVPLEMLVLETDGPYLLPEPLRSAKQYPNKPSNLSLIANQVAEAKGCTVNEVIEVTEKNGKDLFRI